MSSLCIVVAAQLARTDDRRRSRRSSTGGGTWLHRAGSAVAQYVVDVGINVALLLVCPSRCRREDLYVGQLEQGKRWLWFSTSLAGDPVVDCLCDCSALRNSRCFLSSASLAFLASISSRRCAIVESMMEGGGSRAPSSSRLWLYCQVVWLPASRRYPQPYAFSCLSSYPTLQISFVHCLVMVNTLGWGSPKNAPSRDGRNFFGGTPCLSRARFRAKNLTPQLFDALPTSQSARPLPDRRHAINARRSLSSSAIGPARRASALPTVPHSDPHYVHFRRRQRTSAAHPSLNAHPATTEHDAMSFCNAEMAANAMIAGSPLGCPGHRCLLRPLQPDLDIGTRACASRAARVPAEGVFDPAGQGRVGKEELASTVQGQQWYVVDKSICRSPAAIQCLRRDRCRWAILDMRC